MYPTYISIMIAIFTNINDFGESDLVNLIIMTFQRYYSDDTHIN